MENEIVSTSQSDNDVETVFKDDSLVNVREMFGLPQKVVKEDSDEGEQSVNDETPAKADVKKEWKRVVKFNKEDREIDESEMDELLQKGLGLEKERERTKQHESDLNRTAKLLGFKDHSELIANLEKLEKQQSQDKQQEQDTLRDDLLDQLEANGIDRAQAESFIENHPLIKQGKEAIEKEKNQTQQESYLKGWQSLYDAYPTIVDDSHAFNRGETPTFFTPEMKARVDKGYDPIDAYELTHKAEITNRVSKSAEQRAIKDLQLGNRSKVETIDRGTQETRASEELKGAFAMFGIDPKRAQKYAK